MIDVQRCQVQKIHNVTRDVPEASRTNSIRMRLAYVIAEAADAHNLLHRVDDELLQPTRAPRGA